MLRVNTFPAHVFDRVLSDAFASQSALKRSGQDWIPAIDILEKEDAYVIHADLPGIDKDSLDISLEGDVLTIKGERKLQEHKQEEKYQLLERSYGVFVRRFTLPKEVNAEQIAARSKDGVLEVTLPKVEPVKSRRIEIQH